MLGITLEITYTDIFGNECGQGESAPFKSFNSDVTLISVKTLPEMFISYRNIEMYMELYKKLFVINIIVL